MLNNLKPLISIVVVPMLFAFSCQPNQQKNGSGIASKEVNVKLIKIITPTNGTLFPVGEKIDIGLKLLDDSATPDSIVIYRNDRRVGRANGLNFTLNTTGINLGTQNIRATAWKDSLRQTASIAIKLKSDVPPNEFTYKTINTFPHDPDAYTQGLFFLNGFLYEGTGQWGSSGIRQVELQTGKVLQSTNLEKKHFGEGISLFGNKIYQLTWTSEIGFIYDANTFKQVGTFTYSTQGWGLTTNGKELIMSDGSNVIYFIDPESFTELHRIEVFDNKGAIDQLNELELINGELYANVYQTDHIVIIDPETGRVKANIDFKGLLKESDKARNTDVLNGIAWDEAGKRLFVTGKRWPKLFQVVLISK